MRPAAASVTITVNTTSGFGDQLQFKDDLATPIWTDVSAAVTDSSRTHSFIDTTTGHSQRIYRVVRTP
jgi:hypothetical protein